MKFQLIVTVDDCVNTLQVELEPRVQLEQLVPEAQRVSLVLVDHPEWSVSLVSKEHKELLDRGELLDLLELLVLQDKLVQ